MIFPKTEWYDETLKQDLQSFSIAYRNYDALGQFFELWWGSLPPNIKSACPYSVNRYEWTVTNWEWIQEELNG